MTGEPELHNQKWREKAFKFYGLGLVPPRPTLTYLSWGQGARRAKRGRGGKRENSKQA